MKSKDKLEDIVEEKTPHEIMDEAIKSGRKDFYVAYSGGKDSGIALDFVAKEYPDYFRGVVFAETGIGTDDTTNFIKQYCKDRNYPLFIVKPEDVVRKRNTHRGSKGETYSYEALVLNYGFPKQAFHTVTMRHLKYFPLRKFIYDKTNAGEKPCIVGGIRKNESARRKMKWNKYFYNDGKMWFVSPIFFKSNEWVYEYFIKEDIKRSPVYETLHISGDCLCGCFAQKEELDLLKIFHPEVYEKIKSLESKIKNFGTDEAKENQTWGLHGQSTHESDDDAENFICNDCFFDRDGEVEKDTERFNLELDELDKKLADISNKTNISK